MAIGAAASSTSGGPSPHSTARQAPVIVRATSRGRLAATLVAVARSGRRWAAPMIATSSVWLTTTAHSPAAASSARPAAGSSRTGAADTMTCATSPASA
jgi:hypothetical protein